MTNIEKYKEKTFERIKLIDDLNLKGTNCL